MRKVFVFVFGLVALAFLNASTLETAAVSPHIVISQFQVAGGVHNDEFIELHNTGASSVDLNGYRVVYRSSTGSNDVHMVEWTLSTIVPAGGYYLVASDTYDGGGANATYTTGTVSMSGSSGGIAIRNGGLNVGFIIDAVGYGSANNGFVETATTVVPTANNSRSRLNNGCQDTDNNSSDFTGTTPSAPKNNASPVNVCGGGGTSLFAAISANPTTVSPGGNVFFAVSVVPATTPPSTGITVVGNFTNIGGSATQNFFDDGSNGDVTAGDNIFSFLAAIPAGSSGGIRNITAVASDAQARTVNLNQSITINAPLPNDDPLIFGNPSNATGEVTNENNYLMLKPQYTLSYNRSKGTANWVAWRLDSSWIGSTPRQDDFRPDTVLPAGWYQVLSEDYSGSGYDRGHMCPSGDRTNSIPNNSATFLMTNIVPQLAANNQGPWEEFESYCRTLASQGNEIYIFSGPLGSAGTIAQGNVTVPAQTWKVVLVLPNGSNDVQRVTRATRVFGIIVPNQPPLDINAPWRQFRVPVNTVENLTGHDFFTVIPKGTQELIERRRDLQ